MPLQKQEDFVMRNRATLLGLTALVIGVVSVPLIGCGGGSTGTTATPSPTPTPVPPILLSKSDWQADFTYLGGSMRLQPRINQAGASLSGTVRDNIAEMDIVTSGTVTGSNAVLTFTLSNGGSTRGSVTLNGTIGGSPQKITGTFTSSSNSFATGKSGEFTLQ